MPARQRQQAGNQFHHPAARPQVAEIALGGHDGQRAGPRGRTPLRSPAPPPHRNSACSGHARGGDRSRPAGNRCLAATPAARWPGQACGRATSRGAGGGARRRGHDFAVDRRPAGLGMGKLLDDNRPGALAQHHAATIPVERPADLCRIAVSRRPPPPARRHARSSSRASGVPVAPQTMASAFPRRMI